jgi:hypothetical protein
MPAHQSLLAMPLHQHHLPLKMQLGYGPQISAVKVQKKYKCRGIGQ